jgi:hypothetical protein
MNTATYKTAGKPGRRRTISIAIKAATTLLLLALLLPGTAASFDLPDYDPWYFQSDDDWLFMVPDKAQHYYGSQMLVEVGMHPSAALAAGFMYEVYQNEIGVGFSYKDLIADAFGVLAGTVNSEKFYLFMDYSTRDEILQLNAVLMF